MSTYLLFNSPLVNFLALRVVSSALFDDAIIIMSMRCTQ